MGARGVSQEAIAEAAETIAEKIDVLLERATDAVLGAPRAGSPQWRQEWESRESDSGRAALEQRVQVKIAIAELAGVDPRHEIARARLAGVFTPHAAATEQKERQPRRRGRNGTRSGESPTGTQQLAIW